MCENSEFIHNCTRVCILFWVQLLVPQLYSSMRVHRIFHPFLSSTRLTLWIWTPVKYIIVNVWAQAHSMHREQFVFVDFNNLVYRAKWLGHHNTTHQFSLSDTHANTHTHTATLDLAITIHLETLLNGAIGIILGYQECHVENSAFVQTKGILDFILKLCSSGENAFGTQQM